MSHHKTPASGQQLVLNESAEVLHLKQKVKIIALPGTGKTFLLDLISKAFPKKRFLYLTPMQDTAQAAKKRLGPNVTSLTLHAFTLSNLRRGGNIVTFLGADKIKESLNISQGRAFQVKRLFDEYVDSKYVKVEDVPGNYTEETVAACVLLLSKMWRREVPITHGYQLKEFQVKYKDAPFPSGYDALLIDEVQGFNDCAVAIINNIDSLPLYAVGDPNQAILGFANAKDALKKMNAHRVYYLDENFRSSDNIIESANRLLLEVMGEPLQIKASDNRKKPSHCNAVITRTNENIIPFVELFNNFALSEKNNGMFTLPLLLARWIEYNEVPEKYMFLKQIKDSEEFYDYVDRHGELALRTAYGIAKRNSYKKLLKIEAIAKKRIATSCKHSTLLTTAHSSIGKEFKKVRIASDFPSLLLLAKKVEEKKCDIDTLLEECRLYFVAITRAEEILIDKSPNANLSKEERQYIQTIIKENK